MSSNVDEMEPDEKVVEIEMERLRAFILFPGRARKRSYEEIVLPGSFLLPERKI